MIDPKAITKAMMLARKVADDLGLGKLDVLDRPQKYAKGGFLPPGHPEREANLARHMEGSVAPPVLYHGTSKDADFKKFNIPKNGAWFTTSTDDASSYAKENDSQGYKSDWGRNITPTNTASRVVPVHLSAKNPKVYEDPKEFSDLTYSLAKDNYKRGQGILFDQLRQDGHDSVRIGGNTWVALSNPAQIKSATGNSGQFDPSNPDITKAEGGEVDNPVEQDNPAADAEMQHEANPLEYSEGSFGLHQFVNDNIGFAGGARTGMSGTEGTHRLRYAVYDLAHPSGQPTPVGKAELNFHPETKRIEGIVNLQFDKEHRGKGYGTRAVKALAASNPDGLQVYDIKKSAKPFWAKMGAEFRKGDPKNRELASQTIAAISHEVHKAGGGSITKAEGGEVDVQYDNPGGNWLKHEREDAEVVVQKRGNIGASGALTAWSKPVHVDPAKLSKIPGSMNERPEPGTPNYDELYKSMSAEGYKNNNYVLVGINHRGEPHIIEGNHRAAVARDLGVKSIPAKFHWFAGGEQADGFKPEHIKSLMPDIAKAEGGTVLSGGFTGPSAIASAPAQRISIPALPTMQSVIGGNSFQMYAPTVASRPDYDHSSVFAPVAAAPSAALQRQYPTATADQLNEYERAIAGGGDPKATRSLMQAYGPASGVKELQPWSSEFKGFDYARSRPVDDFGNPIGWSAPDRTPPTTGADGVPSGWDARDWENMKNFDPGNPSDEYILNNPWNYGMDTLGNPGPLTLGYPSQRAEERSSTGPGIAEAKALYQSNKNVESQRQAAMAQNAAALGDPNDYAESYPGSPTQPAYGYTAPWANQPAAQPAAGQSAPKSSSSSLPSNFSFGNLGQVGAKILGLTPLGIPITLANSILTGTNTIPQAQTTGSRVLDQAATQGPITNFLAKNVVNPVSQFFGGSPMPKARGGSIFDPDPEKTIRKALMLAYGGATFLPIHGYANGGMPDDPNPRAVIGDNNPPEPMLQPKQDTGDISPKTEPTYSESRVLVRADGPGPNVKGIVVPQHLLDGGKGKNDTWIDGMNVVNKARERVYGSEPRQPLNVGKIAAIHKDILSEHFAKPIEQQMADERAALQRLRDAKHLSKDADTLDKSDKLDTINYETGPNGEKYTAFGSKGIAGHALYHVGNGEYKIVNTCAGATDACSGGVSKEGIVDTLKGNCFAPNAENQYAAAAVKRTCHEQAKHDPAMTSDFILAHTGSLRNAVRVADKQGKHLLFRPNTLDETDRSSVNVIKNLNDQRKLAGLPMIITNAYSKAGDFHDPENGTFRTYSNVGPKVKFGHSVREHYARDNGRIRETISAANPNGSDFANEQGNKTPAKNSYFVTDVPRFSDLDQKMRDSITHVKYWSAGVPVDKLKKELAGEDEEAHYDGSGNLTSPDKSHYGHITYNGRRYDYQRQHVLHPRFVQTGVDSDGKPKLTPTDSRFLDDYFLPEERYMTKNGKKAGAILMTTPTTSTKGAKLYSPFMHHVGDDEIQNALNNNGEYEVDAPRLQEEARGKEYNLDAVLPKRFKKRKADGGAVDHDDFEDGSEEYMSAFPEQSFFAQRHNAHRVTPHEYM